MLSHVQPQPAASVEHFFDLALHIKPFKTCQINVEPQPTPSVQHFFDLASTFNAN